MEEEESRYIFTSIEWPSWQQWSASFLLFFCFVLTAFIIHLYISLYFNMNNAGGIRGERGMWERGATQHVSLAVLCFCSPQSGGGGGGFAGLRGEDSRLVQARVSAAALAPCMLPLRFHLGPDCLLTWPLLLSDLIKAYKSKSLLSAAQPSSHSNMGTGLSGSHLNKSRWLNRALITGHCLAASLMYACHPFIVYMLNISWRRFPFW